MEGARETVYRGEGCFGHTEMLLAVEALCRRYDFVERMKLGDSILGREIPLLRVGSGKKVLLYVGCHHGMEWLTSALLLRFLEEVCRLAEGMGSVYGLQVSLLLKLRTVLIAPMLNPDGAEMQIHGADPKGLLYDRQLRMNGGSTDFSHWQANARGVDLNHNYDAGFAAYKRIEMANGILTGAPTRFSGDCPESEPETAVLAGLVRSVLPSRIFTFHTQGEEIYAFPGGIHLPGADVVAKTLSAASGYALGEPEGSAAYGGLTDWAVTKMGIPAFTFECGRGENPLPPEQFGDMYATLRRMLFYTLTV